MLIRIATFNLENLDDGPKVKPPLADRIRIMKPQIERIAADILCLQEVNSQGASGARTLFALDQLLAGTRYAAPGYNREVTTTTGGQFYDERNLVVLSRFPIKNKQLLYDNSGPRPSYQMVTAKPPSTKASLLEWERPLLYLQIDIGHGSLHLINTHLKSKLPTNIPNQLKGYAWQSVSAWAEGSFISSMKRLGQALQARMLIDSIFDANGLDSFIAMAGDFNSEADEVCLRAILGPVEETGNPDHAPRIMVPCENNIADSARYSLFHLGKGQMLDHIIVSRPLLGHFIGAEIHNEALPDESGAFRTDTNFPESDHAPVIAMFDFN
jgi:endonuclease/exonuclease/phosphatase family metal-dependent hydrolase